MGSFIRYSMEILTESIIKQLLFVNMALQYMQGADSKKT